MSLVERQPSTLRQSKVSDTAWANARFSAAGSTNASVVRTASIVAIAGESMAAPLAIPPTIAVPAGAVASFATVSVVRIALRRVGTAVGADGSAQLGDTRLERGHGHRNADEPGRADEHVGGRGTDPGARELAHPGGVAPARFTRRRVRVPGAEQDRGGVTVGQMGPGDLHGRGLREIRGEHRGRRDRVVVVGGDEREVGRARLLDAAREPARDEPLGRSDAHGWIPTSGSAVVSGKPSNKLAAWII